MIRVCLADDQVLVRSGISALLQASGEIDVVAEVSDGFEAIKAIVRLAPDVVILDVRMPRLDGVATLDRLKALNIQARVVLLTTFDDDEAMVAGIRAGALAFLLKDVEVGPLVETVRRVARGQDCLAGLPAQRLVEALQRQTTEERNYQTDRLTQREKQVLGLMCAGLSNQDIAEALSLSLGTTKNHVSVILAKLQTTDRTKAVLRALKDRLV